MRGPFVSAASLHDDTHTRCGASRPSSRKKAVSKVSETETGLFVARLSETIKRGRTATVGINPVFSVSRSENRGGLNRVLAALQNDHLCLVRCCCLFLTLYFFCMHTCCCPQPPSPKNVNYVNGAHNIIIIIWLLCRMPVIPGVAPDF